jgi:hypothetical protein
MTKLNQNTHTPLFRVVFGLFLLSLVSVITYYLTTAQSQKTHSELALQELTNSIATESEKLARSALAVESIVTELAADLHSGSIGIDDIDQRLEEHLRENKWMYGLGVAFQPFEATTKNKLRSFNYIVGASDQVQQDRVEYDYTKFEHEWYRKPLLDGASWGEPYFSLTDKALVVEYGAPFWMPGRDSDIHDPSGVVYGNLSIEKLKRLITFDNDFIAYYQLLSEKGRFIIHPDERLVLTGSTIFEQAWEKGDDALNSMAVLAVRGEKGVLEHIDPVTKESIWMIYQPVSELPWSLVAVVDRNRLTDHNDIRTQWFLLILLSILASLLLIGTIYLRGNYPTEQLLSASIIASLSVFIGIGTLWTVAVFNPDQARSSDLRITSTNVLNDFKNRQIDAAIKQHLPPPKFIDTGVYLQSIEFQSSNDVKISGYVWQHYLQGDHYGIARGIVLPEADTPFIKEVYRDLLDPNEAGCFVNDITERDCTEVIGWYVSATLRQEFDYSLYPLDAQQVWLRIWHESFKDNIVLTPSLDSYAFSNPKLTPGVQHDFVLPGWDVEESWFSLHDQIFSTNFGDQTIHGVRKKPELLYNVSIERQFLTPFVSRIIPVALISTLMFLMVLISTKSSTNSKWLGFSANDVVRGLAALFFVIGYNHAQLRLSLQSSSIMYFEYFYFVIYVMLLYVAVAAIHIANSNLSNSERGHFITKILYWPICTIALFLITFVVFY